MKRIELYNDHFQNLQQKIDHSIAIIRKAEKHKNENLKRNECNKLSTL